MTAISPELITAFFVGTGAIISSLLGFAYKIWKDHNRIIKEMSDTNIKIIQGNTKTNEEMRNAISTLKESTDRNTEATKVTAENTKTNTDTLNKLMLEIIRKS